MATVVELVAEAGAPLVLSAADKRAIRKSVADPALIADAFAAAARREWGDDWLQQNLSARLVIQRLSGYLAWRASLTDQGDGRGALLRRSRPEERLGPARDAYSWEGRVATLDQDRVAGGALS